MKSIIFALLALVSTQSHANYDPTYERPVLAAEMQVQNGRFAFQNLKTMKLVLTKRDGSVDPTGLNVSYKLGNENAKYHLVFAGVEDAGCGSKQYVFQLPTVGQPDPRSIGARVNVVLIDHSTRTCRDLRPYRWEGHIRLGYGWCGTMDATAELFGNPKFVATRE